MFVLLENPGAKTVLLHNTVKKMEFQHE